MHNGLNLIKGRQLQVIEEKELVVISLERKKELYICSLYNFLFNTEENIGFWVLFSGAGEVPFCEQCENLYFIEARTCTCI